MEEWTYTKLSDQKRKSHQALSSGELKKESIIRKIVLFLLIDYKYMRYTDIFAHKADIHNQTQSSIN